MKLNVEIIDCESKMSPNDKKILREVLTTIEKINDQLEYKKSMYIDYNEHSLSYMIRSVRTDWPISLLTFDTERLREDVNMLKEIVFYCL